MIRPSTQVNIFLLCGGIFTFVGTIFLIVSVMMLANIDYIIVHGLGNVELLPVIFGFVGGLSIIIGIVLFIICIKKLNMKRKLIQQGGFVLAEITGIPFDYSVRVNGWPTFRIECSYRDPKSGIIHMFWSETLLIDPAYYITQHSVRVFVDRDSDYKHYYVDMDSILPEIKQH